MAQNGKSVFPGLLETIKTPVRNLGVHQAGEENNITMSKNVNSPFKWKDNGKQEKDKKEKKEREIVIKMKYWVCSYNLQTPRTVD